MRRTIEGYHPLVQLGYFALAIGVPMALSHPIALLLALLGAVLALCRLPGRRSLSLFLRMLLPLMLLTALLNPLFNHRGVTILWRFPSGNALTLESLWFGCAAAVRFGASAGWFLVMGEVFGAERVEYLLGRAAPSLGLLLSMTLRFVPRFRARLAEIQTAQTMLEGAPRGILPRIRRGGRALSAMLGWSLEDAVDTADSMKSRGYGLPGRSHFSIYRITPRDIVALCLLALCLAGCIVVQLAGAWQWEYYPAMSGRLTEPGTLLALAMLAIYYVLPLLAAGWEDVRWRCSGSNT